MALGVLLVVITEQAGREEGKFVCDLAKERGGNKVGMLSLLQDRENAQKYLKGAQDSFASGGCDLVQVLQTHGLTVKEAVDQTNDLLTAHPDIKAIFAEHGAKVAIRGVSHVSSRAIPSVCRR